MHHCTILLVLGIFLAGCNLSYSPDPATLISTSTTPPTAVSAASGSGVTPAVVPTRMPSVTGNSTATQAIPCTPREDWSIYTVAAGDTLYGIAEQSQSSVVELVIANCLGQSTLIHAGDQLRVPHIPVTRIPQPHDPQITNFETTTKEVEAFALQQLTARIPVTWIVINRGDDTNLAFEQVMPDGAIVNVELPRDDPLVPSSGAGVVAPIPPMAGTEIVLQLRIFALAQRQTIAIKRLTVPVLSSGQTPTANCTVQTQMAQGVLKSPAQASTHLGELGPLTTLPALARTADGKFVKIPYSDSVGWLFVNDNLVFTGNCSAIPIEGGAVQGVQVVNLTTVPNPAIRGSTITIRWDTIGAVRTEIRVLLYDTKLQQWGRPSNPTAANLPTTGTWTFMMPLDAYYGLRFDLDAIDAQGNIATARSDEVKPQNFPCFWNAVTECASAQTTFSGTIQEFEHGYLMWQQEFKIIYVINVGWHTMQDTWQEGEVITITDIPPAGLLAPKGRFAKLWNTIPEIRQRLGWAKSSETSFTSPLQQQIAYYSMFNGFYMRWPNGSLVKFIGMIGDKEGPSAGVLPMPSSGS